MKKILMLVLLSTFFSQAQVRYVDEVFPAVRLTSDLKYGEARTYLGNMQILDLDVYEPLSDNFSERPLIIFAHDGFRFMGILERFKATPHVVTFCESFAKRGYVAASINYRMFMEDFSSATCNWEAIFRGVQDIKAAVRFFRKPDNSQLFRIDTNKIFVGGFSAGAIIALHSAYLNEYEIPNLIDTMKLGNLEGNSGNPGYSSKVSGVISCYGGIGDTSWIEPGNVSVFSMHGVFDSAIPIRSGPTVYGNIFLYGGSAITERASNLKLKSYLMPMFGLSHGFPGDSTRRNYFVDSTIRTSSRFLYEVLTITNVDELAEPLNCFYLYQNYPNPFNSISKIKYQIANGSQVMLKVFDLLGREVVTLVNEEKPAGSYEVTFNAELYNLASGVYFYRLTSRNFSDTKKLLILK